MAGARVCHAAGQAGGEDSFRPRIYGKSELACLYFPGCRPETAMRNLRRWIAHCPALREGLHRLGHDKNRKFYLRPEVELIVKNLGEP